MVAELGPIISGSSSRYENERRLSKVEWEALSMSTLAPALCAISAAASCAGASITNASSVDVALGRVAAAG